LLDIEVGSLMLGIARDQVIPRTLALFLARELRDEEDRPCADPSNVLRMPTKVGMVDAKQANL